MSFFTVPFLFVFLPVTLAAYYLLNFFVHTVLGKPHHMAAQNGLLLLASVVFLVWLEPLLVPLFLLLSIVCLRLGMEIKSALWENHPAGRYVLAAYILLGGIFVLFQVSGTLAGHGLPIFGLERTLLRTYLPPAGMAIFTLRAIAYVSDVYRQKIEAEKNIVNLGLYLCFFPHMVVGPLQSYGNFRAQLQRGTSVQLLSDGVCRLLVGIGKKILLADNLAVITDNVFALSASSGSLTEVPVSLAWLGIVAFSLQVYYDFTAFSDVAIGLTNLFGFTTPENFNYPYVADSITGFWERWLITIKWWFTRYVSKPLDRMRSENNDQLIVNTFIAFVAMGVWHKASIGMLIWGFLQVFCVAVERVTSYSERRIPKLVKHGYVILVVMLGWALLRYSSFNQTLLFLRNLFGLNQNGLWSPLTLAFLQEYWVFFAAALLFIFPVAPAMRQRMENGGRATRAVAGACYVALFAGLAGLCLVYFSRGLYVPGVYFSF
ncbi:hypothetical protein LJC34_03050 [Oscillospiraceae bacterium OttesenSCG-928-G22]|nr:hypothetical protein [Oscillospiraceae bacterium OttesenSCG-928-G22]